MHKFESFELPQFVHKTAAETKSCCNYLLAKNMSIIIYNNCSWSSSILMSPCPVFEVTGVPIATHAHC
jgi:hypothetical protein